MHETLGAVSLGAGTICLALAAIINALHGIEIEVKANGRPIDAREAGEVDRHATVERMASAINLLNQPAQPAKHWMER